MALVHDPVIAADSGKPQIPIRTQAIGGFPESAAKNLFKQALTQWQWVVRSPKIL